MICVFIILCSDIFLSWFVCNPAFTIYLFIELNTVIVIFRMWHCIPWKMHSFLLIFKNRLIIDILNFSLLHLTSKFLILLHLFYSWWRWHFCWLIFHFSMFMKLVLFIIWERWSFSTAFGMPSGLTLRM